VIEISDLAEGSHASRISGSISAKYILLQAFHNGCGMIGWWVLPPYTCWCWLWKTLL